MRTMKQLAQEAVDIQNAGNLSGVVHSFSRAITEVREHLRQEDKESNDNINRHPICILYTDKIVSLTGAYNVQGFPEAYNWAQELLTSKE